MWESSICLQSKYIRFFFWTIGLLNGADAAVSLLVVSSVGNLSIWALPCARHIAAGWWHARGNTTNIQISCLCADIFKDPDRESVKPLSHNRIAIVCSSDEHCLLFIWDLHLIDDSELLRFIFHWHKHYITSIHKLLFYLWFWKGYLKCCLRFFVEEEGMMDITYLGTFPFLGCWLSENFHPTEKFGRSKC